MDYEELVKKCKKAIPEQKEHKERFDVPDPVITKEKRASVIKNFGNIASAVARDQKHFSRYLFKSLAVPGQVRNKELVLQGKVSPSLIKSRINEYMKKYVFCEECGRPDTVMKKEGKVYVIKCEACGAVRTVE